VSVEGKSLHALVSGFYARDTESANQDLMSPRLVTPSASHASTSRRFELRNPSHKAETQFEINRNRKSQARCETTIRTTRNGTRTRPSRHESAAWRLAPGAGRTRDPTRALGWISVAGSSCRTSQGRTAVTTKKKARMRNWLTRLHRRTRGRP
jgi:hypothetical protein